MMLLNAEQVLHALLFHCLFLTMKLVQTASLILRATRICCQENELETLVTQSPLSPQKLLIGRPIGPIYVLPTFQKSLQNPTKILPNWACKKGAGHFWPGKNGAGHWKQKKKTSRMDLPPAGRRFHFFYVFEKKLSNLDPK